MTFDDAITRLEFGIRVQRAGWADLAMGDGSRRGRMWLELKKEANEAPAHAVLMIEDQGQIREAPAWSRTETDIAATDWQEVA